MPGGRNLSGNEKFIVASDKAVEKKRQKPERQWIWRTHGQKLEKKGTVICGQLLPELGSQGSMSSSSLGHSADATSRSSADCGERASRRIRSRNTHTHRLKHLSTTSQKKKIQKQPVLHTPSVYFLHVWAHRTNPSPTHFLLCHKHFCLLQPPAMADGQSREEEMRGEKRNIESCLKPQGDSQLLSPTLLTLPLFFLHRPFYPPHLLSFLCFALSIWYWQVFICAGECAV